MEDLTQPDDALDGSESAFPFAFIAQDNSPFDGTQIVSMGISIRDYLAAKAMPAFARNHLLQPEEVAELAYKIADAMLKAREE